MNLKTDLASARFRGLEDAIADLKMPAIMTGGAVRRIFLNKATGPIEVILVGADESERERVEGMLRGEYGEDVEVTAVGESAEEALQRRGITIDAMGVILNGEDAGQLLDPLHGLADLHNAVIRLHPAAYVDFNPILLCSSVALACELGFDMAPETMAELQARARDIENVSKQAINAQLRRIIRSSRPSDGFLLLDEIGVLEYIMPELALLKGVETKEGKGHKDNFAHTLKVLDNLAARSDNEWLRWAALLHDIGKPATKKFEPGIGWTFRNHNYIGEKMIPRIFHRMDLPHDSNMRYVAKMVGMHMRPQAMGDEGVTDRGVRRMMTEAGSEKEVDELMALAEADLTSKNPVKVKRVLDTFRQVREHIKEVRGKDAVRTWENPINGAMIKRLFGIPDSSLLGELKEEIKAEIYGDALKDNFDYALSYLCRIAPNHGLTPVAGVSAAELKALTKPRKEKK